MESIWEDTNIKLVLKAWAEPVQNTNGFTIKKELQNCFQNRAERMLISDCHLLSPFSGY